MAIVITPDDVREFCSTSLSDAALNALITVVHDAIGECVESSYTEALATQILIYAVCHLADGQKGSVTQKRAANGASISTEHYGTGDGLKSTAGGRMLLMLDTNGCYNSLFASPLMFGVVGEAARP